MPDILSFLQDRSPLVPIASGNPHYIEGLGNFTSAEQNFRTQLGSLITTIDFPGDIDWRASLLQSLNAFITVQSGASAMDKMFLSHGMFDYVMFGLLHDDANGWNAYDTSNWNVGPGNEHLF